MIINNQLLNSYTEEINKKAEDLKIFSIKQKLTEGEYAHVEIIAKQQSFTKPKICLCFKDQMFFKGKLLKAPESVDRDTIKLTFIAKPEETAFADNTIQESFFENMACYDFHIPAVHPVTHEHYKISFFKLFTQETKNLVPFIFSESINFEQIKQPLKKIHLNICSKWLQQSNGIFDIFPFIKNSFFNNNVCTLTGKSFKASFPQMGENLRSDSSNSGYTVVYSKIQEDFVKNIPLKTEKNMLNIPFYQFKGLFLIQWELLYKRQENIHCSINYNSDTGEFLLSPSNTEHDAAITLNIKKSLPNKEKGIFFNTENGKTSIEQACLQTCYKIIRSHFNTLIHIKIPFSEGLSLQCGDVIKLQHNNKFIKGYVGFIEHNIDEYQTETKISLFVIKHYFEEEKVKAFIKKVTHRFKLLVKQQNLDIFENAESLSAKDFIENINISNAAQEQRDGLIRLSEKNINSVKTFLKKHPTVIHVQLKDLQNKDKKTKTYELKGE